MEINTLRWHLKTSNFPQSLCNKNNMKKILPFYFLTLMFIGLVSCSQSTTSSCEEKTQHNSLAIEEPTISLDIVTENKFVYIKEYEYLDSKIFIKVDYVDYLTGQEAADTEWRDEAYFVDGEDTITNITDGYYISNVNSKLRTFRVQEKISVEHIIDDDGPQVISKPKPLDSKQIEAYIKNETLLFLYITNGIVERVDERFIL